MWTVKRATECIATMQQPKETEGKHYDFTFDAEWYAFIFWHCIAMYRMIQVDKVMKELRLEEKSTKMLTA